MVVSRYSGSSKRIPIYIHVESTTSQQCPNFTTMFYYTSIRNEVQMTVQAYKQGIKHGNKGSKVVHMGLDNP